MSAITVPVLDARVRWSLRIVDADSEEILADRTSDLVCETASIGKVFLLIEVAARLESGALAAGQIVEIPAEHRVADSGLLYLMENQRHCVADLALLVGAVSDNLATNALIALCGLDAVRAVATTLGYRDTSLLDYIRNERREGMPWTPSYGTGAELADLMRRLGAGLIVSPAVSAQVMAWLAVDTDTSMVASAFLLDPLAHTEPEYEGMVLRHKTGTTSVTRVDVGHVRGPRAAVAYAVCANWRGEEDDLRAPVLAAMRELGEQIRLVVTGRARDVDALA
ncbi:serine hydrolase [Microbacterium flavum]|uniref:Serine hydrolase n=1 Tax=Microbacterium flavum TaxID=415216 RepID=A0ABS5XV20_9MICO|nr:serine hydrolase [Microbacterium flavum]MBT8798377.1 serine hydrolase [Microbacterium flavum]